MTVWTTRKHQGNCVEVENGASIKSRFLPGSPSLRKPSSNYGVSFCVSCVSAALALTGVAAHAVEPTSFKAGAFALTPTLGVSASHTDNLFLTDDNEVSSRLFMVNPRIDAYTENGPNNFNFMAEIINGEYSATSEDDYTDFRIAGEAGLELNTRNFLNLNASFFDTHEQRGTGFSQGAANLPSAPDEYDLLEYGLSYQFGADTAKGRLVVDLERLDKEYTNNRTMTVFRDREDTVMGATFYLKMMPRTDVLFEYTKKGIDYVNDPAMVVGSGDTLDSDENYFYVGVTWEATGATTGTAKFGYGEKEFDDVDRGDTDKTSWAVDVEWSPRTYSTVTIGAGRRFGEASGVGSALDTTSFNVNWQHEWMDRLSSVVSANYSDDDYLGSAREDENRMISAGLVYNFDRWLDVDLTLSSNNRDSNVSLFEYDERVIRLGFEASL